MSNIEEFEKSTQEQDNSDPSLDVTQSAGAIEETSEKSQIDEFSYMQRDEFTSEIFKIEVRNLGIFGIGEFKKLLKTQLNLDACKIKSPKRREFAFICFRSQADQEKAITVLNGYKWKGRVLRASVAKACADPLVKRRNETASRSHGSMPNKRQKTSIEATCPLASLPYWEQLAQKCIEMEQILKAFGRELVRCNPDARKYCFKDTSIDINMPCEFFGIRESPKINGYRNKSEFTIGKNSEGEIVVGFRLGSYADGSVEVAPIDDLPHVPDAAKMAAKSFQEFVRLSKYKPFNPEHNSGHFRQLMVRTSQSTDEVMLCVGIYSSNLTEEEIADLKKELTEFYEGYSREKFQCTSLYYQDVKRRAVGQTAYPVEHLAGTTHITDCIHGLRFRISPLAFFQINSAGADVLYQQAIDLSEPKPHSTVLDICCGTGTIALSFAKHCKQVIGVDIIPEAVRDAEMNALENSIENCKFYTGNSDDYIQSMVREVVYGTTNKDELDLIAIVDPPRAGLHNKSISAIRNASHLKRLIYISCNPKSAQRNWIDLARPESKAYKGSPFFPKTAVAVDMFPHTAHTEMILLFERASEIEEKDEENDKDKNIEKEEKNDNVEEANENDGSPQAEDGDVDDIDGNNFN